MARKEKHWEDDDGRTIADMSQVKRPSLFGNLPGSAYQREEQPEDAPFYTHYRKMGGLS